MTCTELTNDLLLDYADWQLAPHERNRVARHLDVCEPCRTRRDDLEGMTGALRRSTEAPPTALMAQLDKAVLGALPRSRPAAARPPRRLWPLAAGGVAALVAIAIVALVVGERATRPQPPPTPAVVRETPPLHLTAPAPLPKEEEVRPPTPPPPAPRPPAPVVVAKEIPPPPVVAPVPVPTPPPPAPRPLLGDLNGDGVVDIADARILQQRITLGQPLPANADVNGDGTVDIADVREILRAELAAR